MIAGRGFPAFPARRRSSWGRSWWGRAWVQAMEDTSLDSDQLRRGRRSANSGQVGSISVSPGRISAAVHAPEDTYEAVVRVDELDDDDWRRFRAEVAARAGHIAALLDGEMPHDLVEAAADAGVSLLPGIGDLDPTCTCDAWELPCQHAAALCYQLAWLLDDDPFVLLLLRGQTREGLLDQLQTAVTTRAGEPVGEVLGAEVAALPAEPNIPPRVQVDDLPITEIEPPDGLGPTVLRLLVVDAARRARMLLIALLHGTPEPEVLDEQQDVERLVAAYPELAP